MDISRGIPMKSFKNLLPAILFLLFLAGCSPYYFTIPEKELESKVHKVLVLPPYVPAEFVPPVFSKDTDFQPSEKEASEYREIVLSKTEFLSRLAGLLLEKGSFEWKVSTPPKDFVYPEDSVGKIFVPGAQTDVDKASAYFFAPKAEFIQELSNQYQVDAVYFHALPVLYKSDTYYELVGGWYVYSPSFAVFYEPLMYDSNGEVIFNQTVRMKQMVSLHKPVKADELSKKGFYFFGTNRMYVSVKRDPEEVKKFFYQFLDNEELVDDYQSKDEYDVLQSLCGLSVYCRILYGKAEK